jgi:HD-GYP domain-containing protein (c-di-GMP phosphodiesterase class II)
MDDVQTSDDADELEELDITEELPSPESEAAQGVDSSPLPLEDAQNVIRIYGHIREPLALLDDSLAFIFRNESFKDLLKAFKYPESRSFFTTLERSLDPETVRTIHQALARDESGHEWKGLIAHKAKNAAAVLTKVHIFPFYTSDTTKDAPDAYSVYMDDITEENRKVLRDMFSSLLEASKLKDNDTGKHIERVNLYARLIAKELFNDPRWPDVDKDFIESIGFLAAMHDVGKIGTPDDILNKAGPLNEFEWGIMKEHTKNGAFILSSYPNPMAKDIALSHHEWWNGSGYPYNLEGRMIPLTARIVTIADVYDALRMKRSYKPAYSHDVAMQKMKEEREVHFDPDLIDVAFRVERAFEDIYESNAD